MSMLFYFVLIGVQVWVLLFIAAMVLGVRTKPEENDDPEQQLWMVAHYKLIRRVPDWQPVSATLLREMIGFAREDARKILALPVRWTAYFYWMLLWVMTAPLALFCKHRLLLQQAGSLELLWSSAMTGLLVRMGRCRTGD